MTKEILLIRHTTPLIEPGICYGVTNLILSENYPGELKLIRAKINHLQPYEVFSSPLKRCTILANDLFSRVITDNRLQEINFGHWEMVRWEDIPRNQIENWDHNLLGFEVPGGESFKQLYERTIEFWEQVIIPSHRSKIAVVTHSGVIRSLLMCLLGISPDKIFNLDLNYGTIIEIRLYNNDHAKVKFL